MGLIPFKLGQYCRQQSGHQGQKSESQEHRLPQVVIPFTLMIFLFSFLASLVDNAIHGVSRKAKLE